MDLLDRLLDHDRWATATLLETSRGLTAAQADQEFDIGNGTLHKTFGHMIYNVGFWTELMLGRPIEEQFNFPSMVAMIEDHKRLYATFATLSRQFRDEQRLDETYLDHYAVRKTFGSTILMVVLHNTEHRTEVRHILARLGVPEVPEVDPGLWEYVTTGV